MKYTKEERLDIGQRIYRGEITRYEAAEIYSISENTARDYMRLYRDINQLPAKRGTKGLCMDTLNNPQPNLEAMQSMSKDELILELIKARVAEERLKKDTR